MKEYSLSVFVTVRILCITQKAKHTNVKFWNCFKSTKNMDVDGTQRICFILLNNKTRNLSEFSVTGRLIWLAMVSLSFKKKKLN